MDGGLVDMVKKSTAITLSQGSNIFHEGMPYLILQVIDLSHVLSENALTGEIKKLRTSEIELEAPHIKVTGPVLDTIQDKAWDIAKQRLKIIRPLIGLRGRTADNVRKAATEHGYHINTLYKWIRDYESSEQITSLMPKTQNKNRGVLKLDPQLEAIIAATIEEEYLTKQRKSVPHVYSEIKRQCRNAGLTTPHINTIRNRIDQIDRKLKVIRRESPQKAHREFHVNAGAFPHADTPLSVIQIDHTPLDIIVVDEDYRLPLTKPWITLAIDVYSRMVAGFYISFDTPSAASVGSCLAHSILPKDTWLAEHDIDAEWPCWGLPRTVHADNAKEFRGKMITKACDLYGINMEWRPVARPHFGGHIERLLGTFAKKIHNLPGTTFSNTREREGYDSSKESVFTLKEFESWFANQVQAYHHDIHSEINCTPLSKYEEGIFGSKRHKGSGLPPRVKDEFTLRLNFLPYYERTVQSYGIELDKVFYFSDVIRVWVHTTVDNKSKQKRKFIIRRDPRDISAIWFFDPQLETYFEIPYRNNSFPAVSLWELRAADKHLKEQGMATINEDVIFSSIERMRSIEKDATEKTKKARRAQARRKDNVNKAVKATKPIESDVPKAIHQKEPDVIFEEIEDDIILPFDEIDEVAGYE